MLIAHTYWLEREDRYQGWVFHYEKRQTYKCPHKHRTLTSAQACAEKMKRKIAKEGK